MANSFSHQQARYQIEFFIDGMSCMGCVARIEKHLRSMEFVQQVSIQLQSKKAIVISSEPLVIESVMEQVKQLGFHAYQPQRIRLQLMGLSCAGCVRKVETKLEQLAGVMSVAIHPTSHRADIVFEQPCEEKIIIQQIQQLGYQAQVIQAQYAQQLQQQQQIQQQNIDEAQQLKSRFLWAAVFTLPLFLVEMLGHAIPQFHHYIMMWLTQTQLWIVEFIFSSLVLVLSGRVFYQKGIPALFRGLPDMNSLVAIGTFAAYMYSTIATFFPQWLPSDSVHVYFESTAVIITLILLGRWIEQHAKNKVSASVQGLLQLQARTARKWQQDHWQMVEVDDLECDDVIEVWAGERIPIDGVIISGESYVDESMMTGEPIPVSKLTHQSVLAGTLNQTATLQIKVTTVAHQTVLAQIIQRVEVAQQSKLPIQQFVDKITLVFVPVIFALAVLSFVSWLYFAPHLGVNFALVNAIAVLIVACPCAMGLATPISIMLGLNRSAKLGILFNRSDALQTLMQCKMIAFDKTGTLTEGKPVLTDIILPRQSPFHQFQILRWVGSIEAKSEHPIAQAIIRYVQQQGIVISDVEQVQTHVGLGIQATIEERLISIGSAQFMQQLSVEIQPLVEQFNQLASQAKTPMYVAVNQQLVAILAVSDTVKSSAQASIAQLHQQQISVAMLTGDHHTTAQHVAKQLNIEHVIAEVLPQHKAQHVQQLQQRYGKVCFVGDGINDAPALAQSDIGIAMGSGTDVAIETADVVLLSNNLQQINTAIELSKKTMSNIKQNLFWAFIYNLLLIPLAMGIFYPLFGWQLSPMFAALAMALSSVFVILNALRLRTA